MKMHRMVILSGLAASLLLAGRSVSVGADEKPDPKKVEQAELRAESVADLVAAHELAAFAEKHKVPEAYIAAASLLLKVKALSNVDKFDQLKAEKVTDDKGGVITAAPQESKTLSAQAEAWFQDAEIAATNSKTNLSKETKALITAAKARTYKDVERGVAGGPKMLTQMLAPKQTQVYHVPFVGGLPASVGLQSSGQSKLRFEILGPNGGQLFNLSCTSANYNWTPKGGPAQVYMLRVYNSGKAPTTFTLVTN